MITVDSFARHRLSRAAAWGVVLSRAHAGDTNERTAEWTLLVESYGAERTRAFVEEVVKRTNQLAANGVEPQQTFWAEAWRLGNVRRNG